MYICAPGSWCCLLVMNMVSLYFVCYCHLDVPQLHLDVSRHIRKSLSVISCRSLSFAECSSFRISSLTVFCSNGIIPWFLEISGMCSINLSVRAHKASFESCKVRKQSTIGKVGK